MTPQDYDRTISEKLSGKVRHPEDAGGKRAIIGKILRSDTDQGKIVSIELPVQPQGLVSITGKDIPGSTHVSFGGVAVPILTGRNVLWKGQPILAAASADEEELDDWLSRVAIEINPIETTDEAALHERQITKGDPISAFASAFQVIEETVKIPSSAGRRNSIGATCQREGKNYLLHIAGAWPGAVRRSVSKALRVSRDRVRVQPYPVAADSSLGLWHPAIEACRAALLSRAAKKSVRLFTNSEDAHRFGPGLPGAEFNIKGALDSEGRIMALEVDFTIESGALSPLAEEMLDRVALSVFGVYPCRNYVLNGRIKRGNGPPSAFGPAAGMELGFLAAELFTAKVSEHSLTTPGTWRLSAFPVKGQSYSGGLAAPKHFPLRNMLEDTLARSDFPRKHAACELIRLGRGSLKKIPQAFQGIGLSCAWFGNGFLSTSKEISSASLSVTLDKDGRLIVDSPAVCSTGALQRGWASMAGNILGIDPKSVVFNSELPPQLSDPGPTTLGRNVGTYTRLLELACNDLAKRRFRDALPISVTRSRRRPPSQIWKPESLEGSPFEAVSWGVAVVEVSLSTTTFIPTITRIWLNIDGGRLIFPELARSVVESSSEQSLLWCSENGRPRTQEAPSPPEIQPSPLPIFDIQFRDPTGKRPPKDLSTLPWLLLPAAFLQAVTQAAGTNISTIPVLPESLLDRGARI